MLSLVTIYDSTTVRGLCSSPMRPISPWCHRPPHVDTASLGSLSGLIFNVAITTASTQNRLRSKSPSSNIDTGTGLYCPWSMFDADAYIARCSPFRHEDRFPRKQH